MSESEETTRSQMANFFKERNAIVKRANQICTLCAANVIVICFSICGQMYVSGDENIITAYEGETIEAPQCTFECPAHKSPGYFKLKNWRNNNESSSSGGSLHKNKRQKNGVKSLISPLANMDEFADKLILPELEQLEEKMEGGKEMLAQLCQCLNTQKNVLEPSAIPKDWLKIRID